MRQVILLLSYQTKYKYDNVFYLLYVSHICFNWVVVKWSGINVASTIFIFSWRKEVLRTNFSTCSCIHAGYGFLYPSMQSGNHLGACNQHVVYRKHMSPHHIMVTLNKPVDNLSSLYWTQDKEAVSQILKCCVWPWRGLEPTTFLSLG